MIATIVQCRFGSSRLPGKALKPIAGRPMLEHVLERAVAIGHPVVLATSVLPQDDRVAEIGKASGCELVHRGDEQDVLGRVSLAARQVDADVVIRVTGDCPLLAPDVARDVLELFDSCATPVIATNDTMRSAWPDGLDVEVFSAESLHEAARRATDRADREHVTPWLRRSVPHAILPNPDPKGPTPPESRLSVDTEGEYHRVQRVFEKLPAGRFGWQDTFRAARAVEAEVQQGRRVVASGSQMLRTSPVEAT